MESFKIQYNVPTEQPPVVERALGGLATFSKHIAVKAGHGALLAYAQVLDDMYGSTERAELEAMFNQ